MKDKFVKMVAWSFFQYLDVIMIISVQLALYFEHDLAPESMQNIKCQSGKLTGSETLMH